MANKSASEIKQALAARLQQLKAERANPLQRHPLFPLADDLKLMRGKLGLSYDNILSELKTLGLETNITEVKSFFRQAGVKKQSKRVAAAEAPEEKPRGTTKGTRPAGTQ